MIGAGWVNRRSEESKGHNASCSVERDDDPGDAKYWPRDGTSVVASVDGGSLFDCRSPAGPFPLLLGPFRSIHDFHYHLRGGLKELDPGLELEEVRSLINSIRFEILIRRA